MMFQQKMFSKTLLAVAMMGSIALTACSKPADKTEAKPAAENKSATATGGDTIKVGILHSLSGTMAISETSLKDTALMAINEINATIFKT